MSYLCRIIGCFPALEAGMASSDTMKLVFSGEAFKSVLNKDPLGSVSEVHDALSNSVLPSTSGRGSKIIAIANNVLGVSWTTLACVHFQKSLHNREL